MPPRSAPALFDAANGGRIRRGGYLAALDSAVSEAAATRDLRQLADAGLLESYGEKRGRYYLATPRLADLRRRSRRAVRQAIEMDPYAADADPTLF